MTIKVQVNPSDNTDEKKCEYCGSVKTYLAVTKRGTLYPKWNNNPLKVGYAGDATETYSTTKSSLQAMFAEVFV